MKENFPFTYFLLRYMLGFLAVILGIVAVLVIITYFMTKQDMGLLTLFDRSIISYLKKYRQVNRGKIFTDSYDSTIILIGYVKGRSRKYDKLGA